MIHFAQPLWLAAGAALAALLAWLFVRTDRRQRRALADFASARLAAELTASLSPRRRLLKRALLAAGVFCLCAALARPLAGFRWEETQQKSVDILFAVDTSRSMLTPDVKPDRLTRAKLAVEDLAAKLDGDRLGLIAFAGEAFLQCPLTLDADAFRQSLESLDTQTIPRGGTDIASAIQAAQDALRNEKGNVKILILLSDGEDLDGNALDAAKAAARDGLKIYTVGVGTPGGELIPVPDESGNVGGTDFVRDGAGKPVRSRLDEGMLRRLAEATGGGYQPLGPRAEGLASIYQVGLAPLPHEQNATRMERVPLERFEWPLGLGLAFLLAEPLLGTRRRQKARPAEPNAPPLVHVRKGPRPASRMPLAVLSLLALGAAAAHASPAAGEKAYGQGDYRRAAEEYGQAAERDTQNKKPELQFDYGAAAYKEGNFAPAAGAFQKSLQTEKVPLQQGAYYNFGNTLYRLGQQTEKNDAQKTSQAWQQAVASYEAALKLNPNDADAAYNRDFVKKKLEQLQKDQKQNPQNQQNQNQQNPQNKQDSKQDPNQNSQNQQNQPSQPNPQQGQQNPQQGNPPQNPSGSPDQKPNAGQPDQPKPNDPNNGQGNPGKAPPPPSPDKGDQAQNGQGTPGDKDKDKDKASPAGQSAQGSQGQDKGDKPATESAAPGKMTREEAKSLLDAERGEERKLPLSSKNGKTPGELQNPEKDW